MSDIQLRITDVLYKHSRRIDYNHPAYGKCRCGFDPEGWDDEGNDGPDHQDHVAEMLMAELGLTPIYAPVIVDDDGYTWPHWNEWYDDRRQAAKAVEPGTVVGAAYVTEWVPAKHGEEETYPLKGRHERDRSRPVGRIPDDA